MNFKHLLDPENKEIERVLKDTMVDRCLKVYQEQLERFDPYSISKIMKFVSMKDEYLDNKTLKLFGCFGT
jgi:hypothetical protein